MTRILTSLLLSTIVVLAGHDEMQPSNVHQGIRPDDRLLVASLLLRSVTLEEALRSEYARLADACGPEGTERSPACRVRNVRTVRHRLATLHTGPSRSAPLLGFVHGVIFVFSSPDGRDYGRLGLRLDIELVGTPGRFQPWIPDLDGFYGTHIDGDVRRDGEWVQLVGTGTPSNAWLPRHSVPLRVEARHNDDALEFGAIENR